MTITELIQSGLPWPELRAELVRYPYGQKTYTTDSLDDGDFHQAGTFDEVRRARNFGLITNDQYMEVVRGLGEIVASAQPLEFTGDVEGHPFHGNQYTGRGDADLLDAWTKPGPSGEKLTAEEIARVGAHVQEIGTPSPGELYRGMAVPDLAAAREIFKVGKVIDLPAASFDSKANHASRYAMDDPWSRGEHPVFITVPAGTKSIKMESPYLGEDESIVAGKFKVAEVVEDSGRWRSGPFTATRDWSGLTVKLEPVD